MEDPRQVPMLVHVLRHSYRPSEKLTENLAAFRPPETKRQSSIIEVKSVGALAIDAYVHANYGYSQQLTDARGDIDRTRNQSWAIQQDVDIHTLNERTFDILMGVKNRMATYALGQTRMNHLPDAIPLRDEVDSKYSVFARIRTSEPVDETFREEKLAEFNNAYQQLDSKNLLYIRPLGLTGADQLIYPRTAKSQTEGEADRLDEAS